MQPQHRRHHGATRIFVRRVSFLQSRRSQDRTRLKIKKVTEEKMADGEVKLTVWFTNTSTALCLIVRTTARSAVLTATMSTVGPARSSCCIHHG